MSSVASELPFDLPTAPVLAKDGIGDPTVITPIVVLAVVGSQMMPSDVDGQMKQLMWNTINTLNPYRCVSGGAVGVDLEFERVASVLGYTRVTGDFTVYLPEVSRGQNKPDWKTGYAPRNMRIAKDCTHLLRIHFIHPETSYGSGWTADRARDLGKIVRVVSDRDLRSGVTHVDWGV